MMAVRPSPWDSPAVRKRKASGMLSYWPGAGGGGPLLSTLGVMKTTSSRLSRSLPLLLKSQPSSGMSLKSGTFLSESMSVVVPIPPMTRRSPSLIRTSVSACSVAIAGGEPLPPRLTSLPRWLLSTTTLSLTFVASLSRMTCGLTVSCRRALTNWIWVPAEGDGIAHARGAPPAPADADGLERGALDILEPGLDLHLGQRDVERLPDELLDPLEVPRVVPDEDRVRRRVGLDGDASREHLRRRARSRPRSRRRRGSVERGEGRLGDRRRPARPRSDARRERRGLEPLGRNAEDPLEGRGDIDRVRVGEPDRLLPERPAGQRLLLGLLDGGDDLLGLPGVGDLLPHVGFRLRLGLLEPGRGLALARELLARDDADQVVPLDLLEAAGLEDRLECRLPGDVAERDRHLALHVVADDDVLAALGREDAEEVDDIRVLEVEGDELLARGPRRGRGGRRRGLRD